MPPGVCCDNCQREADGVDAPPPGVVDQNDLSDLVELPGVGIDELQLDSEDETQTAPDKSVPTIKRRGPSILPQRRRGAHLIDAQNSLQQWRAETWRRLYARRPWSNELILPTRVISNIANKTDILTVNDLIQVGGWSQHRAFRHGEELLSVLQAVDDRERTRRESEKRKKEEERLERRRIAEAVKEAKKVETKRRREEERLRRPKKPRLSRAKKQVGGNVCGNAVDITGEKENVAPLSAPGPLSSVMPPTSWTPPRPAYVMPPPTLWTPPRTAAYIMPPTSWTPDPFTPPRPASHVLPSSFVSAPSPTTPLASYDTLTSHLIPIQTGGVVAGPAFAMQPAGNLYRFQHESPATAHWQPPYHAQPLVSLSQPFAQPPASVPLFSYLHMPANTMSQDPDEIRGVLPYNTWPQ